MQQIYRNASLNKNVIIPNVYTQLSSKKILVEDYIEGIPLSRVLRGLRDGRLTAEKLEERGININKIISTYYQEFLRQALIDDFFSCRSASWQYSYLK